MGLDFPYLFRHVFEMGCSFLFGLGINCDDFEFRARIQMG